MKRFIIILLIIMGLLPLFAARKALIIGNAAYTDYRLKNPVNDATDISTALTKLGFEVTLKTDADQRGMDETVSTFTNGITAQDEVLFYYSGHGVQLDGTNYLIPIGATINDAADCRYKGIPANLILDKMASAHITIFILDACRDNPYKSFRSASKGLAPMSTAEKSQYMIVYATESGSVAMDGSGRNSPFTEAMLKYISTSGDEIGTVMKQVSKEVWNSTGKKQDPWVSSNLKDDFYLAMSAPKITPQGSSPIPTVEGVLVAKPVIDTASPIEMVFVEGGTFTQPDSVKVSGIDWTPGDAMTTHQVTISSFYIGKYEITQKQWKDVKGNYPSFFTGDNLPVEQVNWYDCVEFCNSLSRREGLTPVYKIDKVNQDPFNTNEEDDTKWTVDVNWSANGYRLPTAAEWEYAAIGGKYRENFVYAGSNNPDDVSWYFENSGEQTHPVGTKKPNSLGLYDMSGNVEEWCWNWDESDYTGNAHTDPRGPTGGTAHVLRGGCYVNDEQYSILSFCNADYSHLRPSTYGLRVVRSKP